MASISSFEAPRVYTARMWWEAWLRGCNTKANLAGFLFVWIEEHILVVTQVVEHNMPPFMVVL
jgi:hypothetical protein